MHQLLVYLKKIIYLCRNTRLLPLKMHAALTLNTMKRTFLSLLLFLTSCQASQSTDQLLAHIWDKDQSIHQQMLEITKAVTVEGRADMIDSLIAVNEEMERIDTENMATVDSILQHGLPDGLSDASYKTIWIVIDHSSLDKQTQYLPLIEQMAHNGKVGLDEYAVLYDRVAMKQNRPQRYGSQTVQFGTPEAMQLYVWPIEQPEQLDSLRSAVGMGPFTDYLHQIEEAMGIAPKYDTTLTVEELNQMRGMVSQ